MLSSTDLSLNLSSDKGQDATDVVIDYSEFKLALSATNGKTPLILSSTIQDLNVVRDEANGAIDVVIDRVWRPLYVCGVEVDADGWHR